MPDFLSSADGAESLHAKLKQGLEVDYDIYSGDRRTTANVSWIRDFEQDVKSFGSDNDYWSQTECEMVLTKEAVSKARMVMRGTGLGWAKPIEDLIFVTSRDTEHRYEAEAKADSAISYLTDISIDYANENDYKMFMLKEDMRKLSTDLNKFGLSRSKRIRLGIIVLICDNKSLFSSGTVERAESVLERVEFQLENSRQWAEKMCQNMGIILGRAKKSGNLYNKEWEEKLKEMEHTYPDAKENVLKGFHEVA